MKKNELIEALQKIEGNPEVYIEYNQPDGYYGYEALQDNVRDVRVENGNIVIGDIK
jgi:hypothetical protein